VRLLRRSRARKKPAACYHSDREDARALTVCIAALCNGGSTVVCAADRMLTGGDTQFEHAEPKIKALTNAIFVLMAGDSAAQSEIVQRLLIEVGGRIDESPGDWLSVLDVAEMYVTHFNRVRNRGSEQRILAPLGLTLESFVSRQSEMDPTFIQNLSTELLNAPDLGTAAIIAGCDESGGHIYVVSEGNIACCDDIGFVAIGSGGNHAASYFMVEGHAGNAELPETVFRTYVAKRRSEIAPGVGLATDMHVIGPQLGTSFPIGDHVYTIFGKKYKEWRQRERRLADIIVQKVKDDVEKHAAKQEGLAPEQSVGQDDAATDIQ
jgi:ATP-dependent protease HslVU (ClpYQ) peptidase subunit